MGIKRSRVPKRSRTLSLSLLSFLAIFSFILAPMTAQALPENFQLETVLTGLTQPVYLTELPDGRMLVGTKAGQVRIFDPAAPFPASTIYLEIININTGGERGLTSMVLDPQFQSNGFLYIYYTHGSTQKNRISRFSHVDNYADPASEVVIWENPQSFQDCCHYGGGLSFGPDGKLYLTTGEEFEGAQAQDMTRAGGKIIRINADGSVPEDNPFADGPGGVLDEIWALGLRNPYRVAWDTLTNRMYIAEVGGNVDETAREDIHVARRGANFGWPLCEGQCEDPQYDDPIHDYGHSFPGGSGGAVTLGTVYRGNQFPTAYTGAVFFADYVQSWVRYLTLNPDGSVLSVNNFASGLGPIVHLISTRDGTLYLADISGSVKRIGYTSGNQPPVIDSVVYDSFPGGAPVSVSFDVLASDPEGDALTYLWFTGDGNEIAGKNITHEYVENGIYQARVQISDGARSTLSDPQRIQVGSPPTATISQPQAGTTFRAGDLIAFEGSASDSDGTLSESNYSWNIRFGHNTHTHPTLTGYLGSSGSLSINTSGHDYHGDTRYDIELTVTDADGLSATDLVSVFPQKAVLSLATSPIESVVYLDGLPLPTPMAYDSLIGFRHTVSVTGQQCVDGTQYTFSSWSDSGALTHDVDVPETGLSLTANFVATGACAEVLEEGLVLHLEANSGVTRSGTTATNWFDLSGSNNDLSGVGDPKFIPNALNGYPIVSFDGSGDKFQRSGDITGFPVANQNRTVVMLTNYRSIGYGGFLFGIPACNQAFGIGVASNGRLLVDSWCTNFVAPVAGTGSGWQVQAATLSGGQVKHYKNGTLIGSNSHTFATASGDIVLGANLDSAKYLKMDVAAVLVYDRALADDELARVNDYLVQRYLPATVQPPVAAADSGSVVQSGSVTIDVLANDVASEGVLDPASVVITTPPAEGAVAIDPSSGAVTYTHFGGDTLEDTFSYRVSDDTGQQSNTALASITIAPLGTNQPPLAGNDNVSVTQGSSVRVQVLDNDTDPEGELDPASLTVVAAPEFGVASFDAATGELVYQHGGASTETDSLTYRVADLSGLFSSPATVTIQVNPPDAAVTITSPAPGSLLQGSAVTVSYDVSGSGYDHLDISLDGLGHNTVTDPSGSYTFDQVAPGEHSITATLVDSGHNPIGGEAGTRTVIFTVVDSAGSPVAVDDQAGVTRGQVSQLNVLANDLDIDGSLDPRSVFIDEFPVHGSVLVDATTGAITYTHDGGTSDSDTFTYRVLDNAGLTSNAARVSLDIGGGLPAAGLVLRLEADAGVSTGAGGTVLGWADQSGFGNDLTAVGAPQLLAGALNGHPVIDFDGTADKLERTGTLTGFPSGNADRTVYLVSNYRGPGYGGFGFGTPACNQVFGTIVNPNGYLMIQGWCKNTDFISNRAGTGSGWLIQSATLAAGQLSHYRNGELIDSRSNSFNTVLTRLVLGAEIDSNPFVNMQVAAVLVYNRALDATEAAQLTTYFQEKYLDGGTPNQTPVAVDDNATVGSGGTVNIPILQNDSDPDGTIDPTSVAVTLGASHGSLEIDVTTGQVSYSNYGSGTEDSFQYRVSDALGATSNTATVTLSVTPGTGNLPPVTVEDQATVVQGGNTRIVVLANDSDPEGELDPSSLVVVAQASAGVASVDSLTGEIFYAHDGASTGTDTFTYEVSDMSGLASSQTLVTVEITASDATVLISAPSPGEFVQGPAVTVAYSVSGSGYDHLHLSLDGVIEEIVPDSSGSFIFNDVPPGEHALIATLVDESHAPVAGPAASASVLFTVVDEVGSPVAIDDQAGVTRGETARLNVLANDEDIDGNLDPTSVFITDLPLNGTVVVDSVTGSIDYTHDGDTATEDGFGYQVLDNTGLVSNEARVYITITDALPSDGLVLQLEADKGVTTSDGTTVTGWADQSPAANDLVGMGAPQLLTGALNGQPVIDFDGIVDKLERTTTLNGFPAGNTDRTVFLVVNYRGLGYGGFGFGMPACNQMFGTTVTPKGYLMLQGWCKLTDFISTRPGTGAGWLIQSATLQASQLRHYSGEVLIDSRTNSFNTVLNRLVLGAEIDSAPFVDMQVASVLVFNRALNLTERQEVILYLQQKYGIE